MTFKAIIPCILLLLLVAAISNGQSPAQDRLDNLRLQLEEVKAKRADLQDRLQYLDEQLIPENIEKSLAGVGSTKPEELREARQRQLEKKKVGIQNQLSLLSQSELRLETGIAQAEADAYHESAKGPASIEPGNSLSQPTTVTMDRPKLSNRKVRKRRVSRAN